MKAFSDLLDTFFFLPNSLCNWSDVQLVLKLIGLTTVGCKKGNKTNEEKTTV